MPFLFLLSAVWGYFLSQTVRDQFFAGVFIVLGIGIMILSWFPIRNKLVAQQIKKFESAWDEEE
jgi:hypothetical protein